MRNKEVNIKPLHCQRCSHKWEYSGKNPYFTLCPHCRTTVRIDKRLAAGADPNALEADRYDIVTIAAVANDLPTLQVALELGGNPKNVTSRYDGTALIAAAHLGHVEIVRELIRAGAPLDHVNNLGWTALIESIVLGDGGPRHTATLAALIDAGANVNLADRSGATPLQLARGRGYKGGRRRGRDRWTGKTGWTTGSLS